MGEQIKSEFQEISTFSIVDNEVIGRREFCLYWNDNVSGERILITDSDQLDEIYLTHAIKNIPLLLSINILSNKNSNLVANEAFKSCYFSASEKPMSSSNL